MRGPLALREFAALLLGDWLESWRGLFPGHDLKRQWGAIALITVACSILVGGSGFYLFQAIAHLLGPKMPAPGTWAVPYLTTIAYGWFFLCTIWLARTYRRRERVIPLLLSPLPFSGLAAYLMLRDTGLLFLFLSLLAYPFLVGGLVGAGADWGAIALSLPLWLGTMACALAMANVTILLLFRTLPAGWEGPISFATANVLILLLPFLTKGLDSPLVPFYWPGQFAVSVLRASPGAPRFVALALLLGLLAGLWTMVHALTLRCLHINWSKSEEQVPSRFLDRLPFLQPGQGPIATLVLKDWLLTTRAWGEVMIVMILLGVAMRLRANLGLPMLELTGAPLLGTLLVAWALVELLAFLGESHHEGANTRRLMLAPISPVALVRAKFLAIALPRWLLGELALVAASVKGELMVHHAVMGQLGLALMIITLSWSEVPMAFAGDEAQMPRWITWWEKFYQFWRLLLVYPLVGLACVAGSQLAALAWEQHVPSLAGLCFGFMALMATASALACQAIVRAKLGPRRAALPPALVVVRKRWAPRGRPVKVGD